MNRKFIVNLKRLYKEKEKKIKERLKYFKSNYNSEEKIFHEFIFCLLTPQSKAKFCWECVENLIKKNKLKNGNEKAILCELNKVRFKYTKAKHIILARRKFSEVIYNLKHNKDAFVLREWLVKNIKGYGYKEASHFLRNIGFTENFAILDRHILKNLKEAGVIKSIPKTLTKKIYFDIENKIKKFSKKTGIPLGALDLLFWSKETGEIFK